VVGSVVTVLNVIVYAINTIYYNGTIDKEFGYRNNSVDEDLTPLSPDWSSWMYKKKVTSG